MSADFHAIKTEALQQHQLECESIKLCKFFQLIKIDGSIHKKLSLLAFGLIVTMKKNVPVYRES